MIVSKERRAQIERVANALIEKYDLTFPIPVSALAKELKHPIKELRPESNEDNENIAGILYLDNSILVNYMDSSQRQRFTIAHELGHLELHRRMIEESDGANVAYRSDFSGLDPVEIEANHFAASLLMPREQFIDKFNELKERFGIFYNTFAVNKLAEYFNVSKVSVQHRMSYLGCK
ncbi:ImmA/IrrE family metallo-endopeptidase [Francisella philomiragia]|uniref:ImmA/IrrE family metallo-endopeptidase n=1 Tax=Francisella philomiragia TaxID=28110 RepID=A0ABS1GEX4_9GAMM|nr:ImmA/IrrE family metallo-endopeptidase [Francisella philomiragia]MBK2259571.1 ImmA/IrrE family metallo-endopeptidase [Francisella philomiragia]MBK2303263.1 ImmA/IrrE family metallo-endopeptidase [Francisella philomiragia]